MDIDLGFRVFTLASVRLHGADTPELPTPEGLAAKAHAESMMRNRPMIVESYRNRQSFARWVADIYFADSGRSVADVLIDAGHATRIP